MKIVLKKSCDSSTLTIDSVNWTELTVTDKKEVLEKVSNVVLETDSFVYNENFLLGNSEEDIEKYLLFLLGCIDTIESKSHVCKTCSHDITRQEWEIG